EPRPAAEVREEALQRLFGREPGRHGGNDPDDAGQPRIGRQGKERRGQRQPKRERPPGRTLQLIHLANERDTAQHKPEQQQRRELASPRPIAPPAGEHDDRAGRGQAEIDGELQPTRYVLPVGADDRHDAERQREGTHAGHGPQEDRTAMGRFPGDDARGCIAVDQARGLPPSREVLGDHDSHDCPATAALHESNCIARRAIAAAMGRSSKGKATGELAPVIILVRPQLGENIGMAARAMLNCGLSELRLVAPRDGWPNPKAQRAASGADVVLDQAEVFDSVAEAVTGLQRVVATTARTRELVQRIVTARRAADDMRGWIASGERVGILFGPERTGLENDDAVHADTALTIPLNPQFSSLNVAQAVLLVSYEWMTSGDTSPEERMSEHATRPANKDELQNLFDHLERALDQSGFLRHKAMRPAMVNNLRALLQRATMTEQEVRTFHGVIKFLSKSEHED